MPQDTPDWDAALDDEGEDTLEDLTTMKRTFMDGVFCDLFKNRGRVLSLTANYIPRTPTSRSATWK